LEPDKKTLEKSFRKKALKCHPDKGGDPVEFKKLNDAYLKLIGHLQKLEEQAEAIELANSVLIEISKTSVKEWQSKLQTRYGWSKSDSCKNIIFDGPYKQYMGRSKNTGNLVVVLYEDPPDGIPKIHIRSSKYMAWIAENQLPVHMHVEKGRQLAFNQWRIVHMAEFVTHSFANSAPTPAPERKAPKPPKTPKSKRKGRDEPDPSKPKARRDSEATPEPSKPTEDKENNQPPPPQQERRAEESFAYNCGQCGAGFTNLMDHVNHKQNCVPDEDFNGKPAEKANDSEVKPKFQCQKCGERFTNMVWYSKHQGSCKIGSEEDEYSEYMQSEPVQKDSSTIKEEILKKKMAADKAAEERIAAEEKLATVKAAAIKKAAGKADAEKAAADKATAERAAGLKAAAEQKAAEKAAADKAIASKAAEKKAALEKSAAKTAATEKAAAEKVAAEKAATDKVAAEMAAKEKAAADKVDKEKAAAEKAEKDKAEAKKAAADKEAEEKALAARALADKAAAEKAALERLQNVQRVHVNSEKTTNSQISSNGDSPQKSTTRRFSAIIPDDPPETLKEITSHLSNCDQKTEAASKHSKSEEVTNGVTKQADKSKSENINKKSNESNNSSKEATCLGTKTGKITKQTKADIVKQNNGFSKGVKDVVVPKTSDTVEAMEVDEEETMKHKVTPRKSDLPMGSLLKDLPTSAKESEPAELRRSEGRSSNSVRFAPQKESNSNKINSDAQNGGKLDTEVLKLTRHILSSTTNESSSTEEENSVEQPKTNSTSSSVPKVPVSLVSSRVAGSPATLDQEAIRITDTFLHQGLDDLESTPTTPTITTPLAKPPGKSILKKPLVSSKPIEETYRPASQETSAYHLAEKVSQYDACPQRPQAAAKAPNSALNSRTLVAKTGEELEKQEKCAQSQTAAKKECEGGKTSAVSKPQTGLGANLLSQTCSFAAPQPKQTFTPAVMKSLSTPLVSDPVPEPVGNGTTGAGTSTYHPAHPATLSKPAAKLEVNYAQQKLVVNQPLSPTLSRKEVTPTVKAKDDSVPTYSHLSGRSLSSSEVVNKAPSSNLQSKLQELDNQHNNNMKKIQTNHEEDERKKQQSNGVASSSVSISGQASASQPLVSPQKAEVRQPASKAAVQPNKMSSETAPPPPAASILKNVATDLKKLDDVHSTNMKQIENNFKETELRSRQPPSTDHHSARPATLARSRFDSPSSGERISASVAADTLRTQFSMEHHVPRRNETVHDTTNGGQITDSAPITRTATASLLSPEQARKKYEPMPITKSATSVEERFKSPALSRKFDQNFNASPEAFSAASKANSNVHFSEPMVSSYKATDKATSGRTSYADRPPARSDKTYSPPRTTYSTTPSSVSDYSSTTSSLNLSHSKSVSDLPAPKNSFSTPAYSTSTSYSNSNSYTLGSPYSSASSYSYSSPSTSSFPSPSDSFKSTITSNSSYFNSNPASTTYSTSTIDRSRSDAMLPSSMVTGDLSAKIQATKDQHKLDLKKAMNFDRMSIKPPIIAQKLPRPEPSKYTAITSMSSTTLDRQQKAGRRMERERAVLEKVLGDRSSRGRSDEILGNSRSPSYRL